VDAKLERPGRLTGALNAKEREESSESIEHAGRPPLPRLWYIVKCIRFGVAAVQDPGADCAYLTHRWVWVSLRVSGAIQRSMRS
jgi:hypothetical protein